MPKHNPILRIITHLTLPLYMLYAIYIQLSGTDGCGGGFQAGIVATCTYVNYDLTYGPVAWLTQKQLVMLACLGVWLYIAVGLYCILAGGNFLNYFIIDTTQGQRMGIGIVEVGVLATVFAVTTLLYEQFKKLTK